MRHIHGKMVRAPLLADLVVPICTQDSVTVTADETLNHRHGSTRKSLSLRRHSRYWAERTSDLFEGQGFRVRSPFRVLSLGKFRSPNPLRRRD